VLVLLACGSAGTADELDRDPSGRAAAAPEPRPLMPPKYHLGPAEGKARTSLFGVVGEGYKFVYVFDRSGSMGGSGRNALRAVKAELLASLENLDTIHQFQIIFYNERPAIFNPSGAPGRLAFANEQNKRRARRFLDTIVADGGTRHMDALELATKMQPDVIFFLTDAHEPALSRQELDKVQRRAAGITIHAIEFGTGPKPEGKSFLEVLAAENAGQYTYVDIATTLPPANDDAR
jgi:hypothetical protein